MKMYEPMVARMRDELDKLGEVALVRVTVLHPANEPQSAHQPPLRVADPALASRPRVSAEDYAVLERAVAPLREPYVTMYRTVFLASLSHEISLLRAIFGEAEADIAYAQVGEATKASLRSGDPLPAPPQVQALGRLGSAQLSISWNWSPGQPEYVEVLEIVGENGSLSLSLPGPYLRDHQAVLRVVRMEGDTGVESFLRGDHRTAFVRELEAFHESIVTRSEPLSTADGAAYDADLLLQIVRAVARST
jgi:predicted dehydrogenase